MHHHTEHESSLFTLLSSLCSCLVFFSLCLCLLSLSLSVSVCLRVVLCLVLWCGLCGVCGVLCETLKKPCVHSKHPRMYVQNVPVYAGTTRTRVVTCARGAGTHWDVFNVHTGTCLSGHTGSVFTSKTRVF